MDAAKVRSSLLVLILASCADPSPPDVTGRQRAGLGYAAEPNEFSLAIGARAFPNTEGPTDPLAWRVVSAEAFEARIDEETGKESDLKESAHFFDGAQLANDGWSAGIYVQSGNWAEGFDRVAGTNWVVLNEPRIDPGTGALFATSYRLVNVQREVQVPFVGYGPHLFLHLGGVGSDRCCGPSELCDTQGGPENPHCPGGWCSDGTYVHTGSLGIQQMREATGSPYIEANTYRLNGKQKIGCLPPRNDSCYNQTPICGLEILKNPPWGSWNASIPTHAGACGPLGDRPVSGRIVPKECLYRAHQSVQPTASGGIGSLPGGKGPECDGQCYECEGFKAAADSNARPRQCDLLRPMPGDPSGAPGSAGSGICTSTAASAGLEQAQLRGAAGIAPGTAGKGNCQVLEPNAQGQTVKICTECSSTECRKTVERAPSPIAHPSPNANTATTCNTTQSNCQSLPAGAGGGGTGAGGSGAGGAGTGGGSGTGTGGGMAGGVGVQNPPVTQTSPPPPTPKPVPTNRAEPRPSTETTNDHKKSVQVKGEKTQDPLAMASGALELREVDLSFPGPVRPLEFVRSYDSRSRDRSSLGSNWVHNWDVRVVPLNDENRPSWTDPYCAGAPHETTCIMLYVGDTPQLFYREFLSGVFVPQAGVTTATLIPFAVSPGTPDFLTGWLLESADGHNLTFDTDGYMIKDVDRFGNGFTLEYEPTPSGRLFTALCPRGLLEMAPNPADPLSVVLRPQQGPVYASDSLDCRALGSVVGVRAPMARRPAGAPTLHFALPQGASADLQNAKALVESLQNTAGRQPGSPMPWGARLKRVTSVKEIVTTNGSVVTGTGRALTFEYWAAASPTVPGTTGALTAAGLLRAVTGPAGARIEFSYESPEAATAHPTFLNEAFLVDAKRVDGQTPAGLTPTPLRSRHFTYAWARNVLTATSINAVKAAFTAFWDAQANCTFTPVDNCGSKRPVAMNWMDRAAEQADLEATFRTEVVDNIIKVENRGIVESETRYDVDPFSLSFDRAVRQRWGSQYAAPMGSFAPDWDTRLPEGTLAWVEAMPTAGGLDDATTAFLPPAIAQRYGLEAAPTGQAQTKAQGSGMLLPPNSPENAVVPGQSAPIAEGTFVPSVGSTSPVCRNQRLPALRSRLPGYRPSFEYFDLSPQTPDNDSATPGIDVTSFELRRSRLSCDVLARAQTSDARSNDLVWTWQNDATGQMVANRSLGRRKYITLNANRICAWVRDADRDGIVRFVGLNFQGRPLVDAVQGADNLWHFAETLYNADGNVIAQRRTLPETTTWSNGRGDTRYRYLDAIQPSNPGQPMPWHWARRSNVVKVVERPRGTSVVEYQETAGGATPVTTIGRYTLFEYEPLFNQVRKVTSGWLDATGVERLSETNEVVFDYQEGPITNLLPILERQRALGFAWSVDQSLNLQLGSIQSAMAVPLGVGDVNGDGTAGLTGLPSLVYTRPVSGGEEVSAFRWNRGGRLIWTMSSDGARQPQPGLMPVGGTILEFDYLPLGQFSGTPAQGNTGFLGRVRHAPRKQWSPADGPSTAPCPHLAGPYQWLLPSSCSSTNLSTQLQSQRHLPPEVADAIVSQQASSFDGTTSWEYNVTGHVKRMDGPDGRAIETDRDLDGRMTIERLLDNGVEHSRAVVSFDHLLRPIAITRSAQGVPLGATHRVFDEEERVLYECEEFVQGGCARPYHGGLPAHGASSTWSYSPEGRLEWSLDAEGLRSDYYRDSRGWLTTVYVAGDPADGRRTTEFSYDEDGQLTLETRQGGMLAERRRYDGYGRLEHLQDFQERWYRVFRSPRDVVSRVQISSTQFGPALWYQWFERDGFGRALREYTNGTTASELTREVHRRPGGAVWWSRGYGQRPTFTSTNADGEVVWSMDADGELTTVATSMPSSRQVSNSTIRSNGWLTTSNVTILDVLGLPGLTTEGGRGVSRPTFSRSSSFTRNAAGALLRQNDPDGKSTEFVVDLAGRVTGVREWVGTSPATQLTSIINRDRRGAVLDVTDLNSEVTRHVYNSFGQPVRRERPGPNGLLVAEWSYDGLGRVRTVRPGGGSVYQHQYNAKNQLVALLTQDTQVLRSWTRDALGRLETATNTNRGLGSTDGDVVVSSFAYDWLGRLSSETSQVGSRTQRVTSSVYGVNGALPWAPVRRTTTRPDATATIDEFDSLGRQTRLTRGAGTTDFGWTGELLTEQTSAAGISFVQTLTSFDSLAQPLSWATQLNGANALQVDVLRDAAGRIGSYWRQDWKPPSGTMPKHTWRGYTYDSMRRVQRLHEGGAAPNLTGLQTHSLQASHVDGVGAAMSADTWTYTREPNVGSVQSITSPTATAKERLLVSSRQPGYLLGQYQRTTNEAPRTVGHDGMGHVKTDGQEAYGWTVLSELQRAGDERLQYDGLGRLVARLGPTGAVQEEYAYDGEQMVAAFGPSPVQALRWTATWGPGLDNLVSVKKDDVTYLALGDGRGSVGAYVSETTRRVAATLDYTPEGRVAWSTWDAAGAKVAECDQLADATVDCHAGPEGLPFGFHGAFKSPATGLVYFRNRWLSTRTGEWLSQDPLGAVDSANLYAFNAFDAVNFWDPMGLKKGETGQAVTVNFDDFTIEGDFRPQKPGASQGKLSVARASPELIKEADDYARAVKEVGFDFLQFQGGVLFGLAEGVTPGASALPTTAIAKGPRPVALGRAVGNVLGGLVDLVLATGVEGGGIVGGGPTAGATAVVATPIALALATNGTVSIARGASAIIDLAVQSANNGGQGPPGAQPTGPPAQAPGAAPGPAPSSAGAGPDGPKPVGGPASPSGAGAGGPAPSLGNRSALLAEAKAADRGGLTKAGRSLQKHGDRAGSSYPKATGNEASKNAQAETLINEILDSPSLTTTDLGRGGIEYRSGPGRAVRFNADGSFSGFVE